MKKIDFKYIPIFTLIIYVPFHLLEEALGNFPYWMSTHYNLPVVLSYPHWLINNAIFFIILSSGLYLFLKDKKKNLIFGIGILIWALLNSLEHIIFSLIDQRLSPGIYTAFVFLLVNLLGYIKLYKDKVSIQIIIKSIFISIFYWIIPIGIIVLVGNFLIKVFP
jgi:hypothetical protein